MKHNYNNKGRSSGVFLIVILIAAAIVVILEAKNLSALGFGKDSTEPNYVQQAQDAVDAINQRIGEAFIEP